MIDRDVPVRSGLEPDKYEYMSQDDSELYGYYLGRPSVEAAHIIDLLLRLRDECRGSHCGSRY